MSERPYPEGVALDEAWRERRRADRLESALRLVAEMDYANAATNCCAAMAVGLAKSALEEK